MKKLYILISIIIISFVSYMIIFITPKDYMIKYQKNKIDITEEYSKKNNGYYYTINYKKLKYPIYVESKYTHKRRNITKINVVNEKETICLNVYFNSRKKIVCSYNDEIIDYRILDTNFLKKYYNYNKEEPKQLDKHKNIKIYNYDTNDLYIWNYKGLIHFNNNIISSSNRIEDINLFKKDNYSNSLMFQNEKYLIIPNYDSKYYFKKIYIYDMEEKIINDINFDYEISYNSYFMGTYKNKIYLIDKKNQRQYSIDVKRLKVKLSGSKSKKAFYYDGNKSKTINIKYFINQEKKFQKEKNYNYLLINNTLYLKINKTNIKVSNQNIDNILNQINDKIYYISKGKIYTYDINDGEKLLLKSEEWKFNNNNILFIYNNQK